MRFILCALFVLPLFGEGQLTIDLRHPVYKEGILYTNEGGVVESDDLRIQAKSIQYINKEGEHKIEAEGDLLIQYKGKAYVGSELEYDFLKQTGTVYQGKTSSAMWYIGGDEIHLKPDGSYKVKNASITTCENADSSWDLKAGRLHFLKENLLEAKKVRFRWFNFPTFWLPSFKLNLKKFKEPIFRYSINWDKGQGPRAMVRYQFYSWKDFAMYGRLEYRWATGWGGAFETEYFPKEFDTTFVTRSYVGTDRLEMAPDKMFRWRVQGAFHSKSQDQKTAAVLTWDKYTDVRMPNDFKSEDFEVNTAKKTLFTLRREEKDILLSGKVRPRVNAFESIKQDLPTLFFTSRPLELGRTGILSFHYFKASYFDFVYSNQLVANLPSYHSTRVELREKLIRPLLLGPLIVTPNVGGIGIFYGNSPSTEAQALGLLTYGGRIETRAKRDFERYQHQIEPYAEYLGLGNPTVSSYQHYVFSIQDGYQRLNQFKVGVRNLLFSKRRPHQEATLTADLYANAFFDEFALPQTIPRLYLDLLWRLPSVTLSTHSAWTFRHQTLYFTNTRLEWTINENAAFWVEGRYRSRWAWRKADEENFILDVTRRESELLASPLSDQRVTLLFSLFYRPTPFWECQIQSHHGFLRNGQKPYNEVKVDLFTWLSSSIKLRLNYTHTYVDDRVTAGISFVKK
ncbi:MAG: hypothetical protein KGJ02_06375 [Verrucomicrobiota bacterium]|nr:hypothetical protein [Verrucomicrobiota bacterium]